MADFTVVIAWIIRGTFDPVIESVYVPEAPTAADAARLAVERFQVATGIAVLPVEVLAGRVEPERR
ncbi:hypothetical protein CCP1ISM_360007 [Azospirillaceae bacterium]